MTNKIELTLYVQAPDHHAALKAANDYLLRTVVGIGRVTEAKTSRGALAGFTVELSATLLLDGHDLTLLGWPLPQDDPADMDWGPSSPPPPKDPVEALAERVRDEARLARGQA